MIVILIFLNIYLINNIFQFHQAVKNQIMKVEFLDVGQGDSVLITTPNQSRILIDSSASEIVLRKLSETLPYLDKKIDLFIATHADLDHIGGTPFIINKYKVSDFAFNYDFGMSGLTREIDNRLKNKKLNKIVLQSGDKIILDSENQIYLEVLWPHPNFVNDDKNENSIIERYPFL